MIQAKVAFKLKYIIGVIFLLVVCFVCYFVYKRYHEKFCAGKKKIFKFSFVLIVNNNKKKKLIPFQDSRNEVPGPAETAHLASEVGQMTELRRQRAKKQKSDKVEI